MTDMGAFLCYSRDDDAAENGKISWFRDVLEQRVQFHGHTTFELFQDRDSIEYGERWKAMIDGELDSTSLLIPILTPRWFTRDECRRELERFLDRERDLGRDDLVIAINWGPSDVLADPRLKSDELAVNLAERQLVPWYEIRYEPQNGPAVSRRLDQIAARIKSLLVDEMLRSAAVSAPAPVSPTSSLVADVGAQDESEVKSGATGAIAPPTRTVDPFPGRADHSTIRAAIAAAEPGDLVVLRPGVYDEGIVIDKPVEIVGDGDPDDIVVRARGADAVIMETTIARIAGVTLQQDGDGKWFGVDAKTGRLTVENCVITSKSLACVAIRNGAEATVRGNRITGGAAAGVFVHDGGMGLVEDNDISDNANAGVSISSDSNPTVRRNRITSGQSAGVFVYDGGLGLIEDNDISGNAKAGVSIKSAANPTVRGNRITSGGESGVFVYEGGLGLVEDNDISDNAMSGLTIQESGNPTVRGNRITSGQSAGVFVLLNGLGLVEDNDISDNALAGVEIKTEGNPTVRGNRITAGRQSGVFVYEGGLGLVEDNDITDNAMSGVQIQESGSLTIRGNRIRANQRGVWVTDGGAVSLFGNTITDNTDGDLMVADDAGPVEHLAE